MPIRNPRLWLLALLLFLPLSLQAASAAPQLTRHVTDLTDTLSAYQVDQMDARLAELEEDKGAQLVVLMISSTGEQDIADYSLAVAEANRIGRKDADDGLLLVIAKDDHHVRIEVGYGLEGAIPDAAVARIIREYIAPRFRNNDYYGGISDAVGALTQLIKGDSLPPTVSDTPAGSHVGWGILIAVVVFFAGIAVAFGLFVRRIYRRSRAKPGATTTSAVLWTILWVIVGLLGLFIGLLLMFKSRGGRRSIGGGGGSSGGFKGGGGRFGGGGASGGW